MLKRFLVAILLMTLFVLTFDQAREVLGTFLRLDEPITHEIQEGDWLSKVALKHYGDVSYWRELALINRAPRADRIYPGERIVVPSFEAIRQIRKARRLSMVNELVGIQEDIIAGRVESQTEPVAVRDRNTPRSDLKEPASGPQEATNSQPMDHRVASKAPQDFGSDEEAIFTPVDDLGNNGQGSFWQSTPFITGLAIFAVVAVVGALLYFRNKKRDEEIAFFGASGKGKDRKDGKRDSEQEVRESQPPFILGGRPKDDGEKKNSSRRNEPEVKVL